MVLRKAFCDVEEKHTQDLIEKEQRRMHSGEITEAEYEERFESIMQNYRLRVANLLPKY